VLTRALRLESQAFKRFTAVTRGGACKYEDVYLAGLKDRELAKAINGCVSLCRHADCLKLAY
jgi:hypothetical protein